MQLDKFKIKELMAKQGINTQSELAQMLGISKNQLSNILSNRFDPIKSNVNELADFFGVSPLKIIKQRDKNAN
ncbi:hypothetical protein SPONN_1675 [uncultured Candidatus Thioglobus sp.]|nr:hypothetical protein SPONN_1675 [uncultured Candidatus Thioglobus sp.]